MVSVRVGKRVLDVWWGRVDAEETDHLLVENVASIFQISHFVKLSRAPFLLSTKEGLVVSSLAKQSSKKHRSEDDFHHIFSLRRDPHY